MVLLDSSQVRVEAESLVYERLKRGPLSVEEIISMLTDAGTPFSRRIGKEVAWKLAEECKAHFNSEWSLELQQ